MKWTSKIGLGSVQFGLSYGISNTAGQTTDLEVSKILDIAESFGINTIDTASSYGTSESVLGIYANNRFNIVSKFMPSYKEASVENQFEESLKSLNVNKLYGYLAHRPLELLTNKEDWETLLQLQTDGKIAKIGFSMNEPDEYYQLVAAGMKPDLVQVPFNYFDSRFKEIMLELKSKGCEIHTRSTFLQGLFFMKKEQLSDFFKPILPNLEYLQTNYEEKLSAALLKYVLEQPFIDKVILGIENSDQLKENIKGIELAPALTPLKGHFSNELLMPMHWPKK